MAMILITGDDTEYWYLLWNVYGADLGSLDH